MFKNNSGFTLVEMLIVLLIISVLIILIVPTISDSSKSINEKGCTALTSVVQNQIDLYYLEKGSYPEDMEQLKDSGYITEAQTECPNGIKLKINGDKVQLETDNGT